MVCGCIFGWQSVMYQFCDLDLFSRIILSGAYLIYYLREESQICCMDTGPRSAVGNVSGYRCVSDCRSRGHEFDPGPVPYFRGD